MMAKSKKKPKAKQLPAKKKKGAKDKPRPARGFDTARLNRMADTITSLAAYVAELGDRVLALERGSDTPDAEAEQTMGELSEVEG